VFQSTTPSGVTETGRLRVLDSGARLHLVGGTAWVEGSPGKALRSTNYPASPLPEVREATDRWISEARGWVEFDGDLRVNRLDVVRDFDLGSLSVVGSVLDGIAKAPIIGRKVKARYRDAARSGSDTVTVRTKGAGLGRLYDKAAESRGAAPDGVLRFEAQERKASLRAAGVILLDDLRVEALEVLGRDRFTWCGFGVEFDGFDALVGRVMGDRSIPEGMRVQLVGWYTLAATGRVLGLDRTRDYRLRRLASRFGIPAGSRWRLDLAEGLMAA